MTTQLEQDVALAIKTGADVSDEKTLVKFTFTEAQLKKFANAIREQAVPEWVSVEDRLPNLDNHFDETIVNNFRMPTHKTSKPCLVVVDGHVTESSLIWREDEPEIKRWQMLSSGVTHWMYRPAAPTREVPIVTKNPKCKLNCRSAEDCSDAGVPCRTYSRG